MLLVHRPKYDDWTLPKGKVDEGESDDDCALREVLEETGFRCRLLRELPATRYADRFGRPKVVRYWEMQVIDGSFEAHDEVDELRWVSPRDAISMLSYERDASVIEALEGRS